MKILHSIASLDHRDGGPARSVPSLAQAVASAGCDVRVWSASEPTIDLSEFPDVEFVSGDPADICAGAWTADLIHDHGLWLRSNHAVARYSGQQRIPRIVSPRGMLQPWCLKHRRLKKQVAWHLYQRKDLHTAACLHATSSAESRQFRKLGFQQPTIQLPNGVKLPDLYETRTDNGRSRRDVLFLSRIHPVKGLANLVRAWAGKPRGVWHLKIVGSDEDGYGAEVSRVIRELGVQESVSIHAAAHGEEKWRLMTDASVLVLPSFSENFGIVAAEALAVGTPVITTTGTPWSGLKDHRCGWYVEPTVRGIDQALTSAMSSSDDDLNEMGRRGRVWVRSEFGWDLIGKRMQAAYRQLIDVGGPLEWVENPQLQSAA